ncbi:MAG: serine/threonine protein kinase [Labilithrix sp.]|nr:serine/threonine protein kinase [Labilithrix sp.]
MRSARSVGRYALHAEIASGGMATVYFGRLLGPVGFSRTVAIKQLHPQFAKDPDFVSMFLDEARLAARIGHPNVIQTVDIVVTSGELFLVMDYVPGESLARLMRALGSRDERIPVDIACTIMSNVLHGLHAAHEAKNERGEPLDIVHRDVSPHNVLVGVDGVARVLDFGVAKAVGRLHTTREGGLKGKLPYMAPEQIEGKVDRQSDIYSASVVLWEALTGRRLFEGDEGTILAQVLGGMIPPPRSIVPDLPEALEALTLRGLARNAEQRFETAREMALALEACATFTPPSKVGDWVSTIAADTLAKRSALVAEIESLPGSTEIPKGESPLAHLQREGATTAVVASESSSATQPSSVRSGTDEAVAAARTPPRRRGAIALAGVAVAVAAIGVVLAFTSRRAPASASQDASAPETSAAVVTTVTVPAAPASVATGASVASAPLAAPSASMPKAQAVRPRPKPGLGSAIDSRH